MSHQQITPEAMACYQRRARQLRSATFLNFFFGIGRAPGRQSTSTTSVGSNSNLLAPVNKAA